MMMVCAVILAGCQTTTANVCDGWKKLNPSPETRRAIIASDKPFAREVAAHNRFGAGQGCWK